jgi:hypothetical protein
MRLAGGWPSTNLQNTASSIQAKESSLEVFKLGNICIFFCLKQLCQRISIRNKNHKQSRLLSHFSFLGNSGCTVAYPSFKITDLDLCLQDILLLGNTAAFWKETPPIPLYHTPPPPLRAKNLILCTVCMQSFSEG